MQSINNIGVNSLPLATIKVKTRSGFFPKPTFFLHEAESWLKIEPVPKDRLDGTGYMGGHIKTHLIQQLQRSHGHSEPAHGFIDSLYEQTFTNHEHGFVEIRPPYSVNQKTGTVLDHDWRFSQGDSPGRKYVGGLFVSLPGLDNFH